MHRLPLSDYVEYWRGLAWNPDLPMNPETLAELRSALRDAVEMIESLQPEPKRSSLKSEVQRISR